MFKEEKPSKESQLDQTGKDTNATRADGNLRPPPNDHRFLGNVQDPIFQKQLDLSQLKRYLTCLPSINLTIILQMVYKFLTKKRRFYAAFREL